MNKQSNTIIKQLKGVCPSELSYSIDEKGHVHDISFQRGCEGNLKALALLAEGKPAHELIQLLGGVTCGSKNTSCGAQLAAALEESLGSEASF